jgi:Glycosyl hydrolases family 16
MDELDRLLKRYVSSGAAVVVVILGPGQAAVSPTGDAGSGAPPTSATVTRAPEPATITPTAGAPPTTPATPKGTTAAATQGWGTPTRVEEFDSGTDGWQLYDGPGHAGQGRRSAAAVSVRGGLLTITGDASGTTGGMAWNRGRRYGRWEARVRAPAADPSYNAVLLLWPDAENWPRGGEIDFMEMGDPARRTTDGFVHHGADNRQVHGAVATDATQWHHWAVEWTPSSIVMFLDGRAWFRTTDGAVQPPGPMHLCVQLDWFPKGGPTTKSTMQVDWVREYATSVDRTGHQAGD